MNHTINNDPSLGDHNVVALYNKIWLGLAITETALGWFYVLVLFVTLCSIKTRISHWKFQAFWFTVGVSLVELCWVQLQWFFNSLDNVLVCLWTPDMLTLWIGVQLFTILMLFSVWLMRCCKKSKPETVAMTTFITILIRSQLTGVMAIVSLIMGPGKCETILIPICLMMAGSFIAIFSICHADPTLEVARDAVDVIRAQRLLNQWMQSQHRKMELKPTIILSDSDSDDDLLVVDDIDLEENNGSHTTKAATNKIILKEIYTSDDADDSTSLSSTSLDDDDDDVPFTDISLNSSPIDGGIDQFDHEEEEKEEPKKGLYNGLKKLLLSNGSSSKKKYWKTTMRQSNDVEGGIDGKSSLLIEIPTTTQIDVDIPLNRNIKLHTPPPASTKNLIPYISSGADDDDEIEEINEDKGPPPPLTLAQIEARD